MKPHLLRLGLFLCMNGAVLAALLTFVEAPLQQERALVADGMTPNERLRLYLQDFCRQNWQVIPGYLGRYENPEFRDFQLRQALKLYHTMTDNYNATIIDKDHRLKTASGPRIIFVGGSGLAFGLDSEVVAERYGYSPVNMGLSASLGPRFMLQHVAPKVHKGDVAVICFEDSIYYSGPDVSDPQLQSLIQEVSPEIARFFDPSVGFTGADEFVENSWPLPGSDDPAAWKEFADKQALQKTAKAIREAAASLLAQFTSEAAPSPDEVVVKTEAAAKPVTAVATSDDPFLAEYAPIAERLMARALELDATVERERVYVRSAFNIYGDRTQHWGEGPREGDRSKWPVSQPAVYPEDHPARPKVAGVAALINGFAAHCRSRGATVLVALPPRVDYPGQEAFPKPFQEHLASLLDVPVICSFERQTFPESYFYDTRAHLTWEGTKARMAVLLEGLDQHLTPKSDLTIGGMIAARDRAIQDRVRVAAGAANEDISTQ